MDESLSIFDYLRTAYRDLYEMDEELHKIEERLAQTGEEKLLEEIAAYQELLEGADFYAIDSHIHRVAAGLGINAIGLGPHGMSGNYSVMGVHIENTARHPSTIGVAVNVGCWSHRRGHVIFDKDLNATVTTHSGVTL